MSAARATAPARRALLLGPAVGAALALAGAPAARAETELVVRGAGFGHGVGLSQYGAKGMAERGVGYRSILRHYYTSTRLGRLSREPTVRVAVRWGAPSVQVVGGGDVNGRSLRPGVSYGLVRDGDGIELRGPSGTPLARIPGAAIVTPGGGATLSLAGGGSGAPDGGYRGRFEVRPDGDGLLVVNAVGLEDYTRGVVAAESPSGWAMDALRAQAVAARTYAITSGGGAGVGFDQWPDTRSQVYGGVGAETERTNDAVADTSREVVTYRGEPATTYFFSTSGGRTEDVEDSIGGDPKPWLKSVADPDDEGSPRHAWTERFSLAEASRRLGGLAPGGLAGIRVLERGSSPRIVRARVLGTAGARTATGNELKAELGLDDSWARFTVVSAEERDVVPDRRTPAEPAPGPRPSEPAPGRFLGTVGERVGRALDVPEPVARAATRRPGVAGRFTPGRAGQRAELQRRAGGSWRTVRTFALGRDGTFTEAVPRSGRYVVRSGGVASPLVRVGGRPGSR